MEGIPIIDDFIVGQIPITFWLDSFSHYHISSEWPDGKAYYEQDKVMVVIFNLMSHELHTMREEKERANNV